MNFILVINILTVFQLFVFTIFIFHKGRKKLSNIILAILFISEIFGYLQVFIMKFPVKIFSLHFMGNSVNFLWGPLMYIYIKSLVSKLNLKKEFFHFIPFFITLLYFITLMPIELHGVTLYNKNWFWISVAQLNSISFWLVIVYNFYSLFLLYKYEKEIKEYSSSVSQMQLTWLKIVLYGYIIICAINALGSLILRLNNYKGYWDPYAYLLFFIYFTILFYKALISPHLLIQVEEKRKYSTSNLEKNEAIEHLNTIKDFMIKNKPHLNPTLTIKDLSEQTGISARNISQILNQYQNQNFFDFINSYRIEEAKNLLHNADFEKRNMLSIAFDSGFNSKTAFNVTFKKSTGLSPSVYRSKIIQEKIY